jgi:hypothetical protein
MNLFLRFPWAIWDRATCFWVIFLWWIFHFTAILGIYFIELTYFKVYIWYSYLFFTLFIIYLSLFLHHLIVSLKIYVTIIFLKSLASPSFPKGFSNYWVFILQEQNLLNLFSSFFILDPQIFQLLQV